MPELVDLLGPRSALLLVIAFGGLVLRVPRFDRVSGCLAEAAAAIDLLNGSDTSRNLAKKHGVLEQRLLKVYGTLLENRKAMQKSKRAIASLDDKLTIGGMFNAIS